MGSEQIAKEYELEINRVREAQSFYNAHRPEIDASIQIEKEIENTHD